MSRSFDLIIACLVLVVTAPLLVIIALTIRIESGRPILYRRRCVGMNGRPFDMLRFRTMSMATVHPSLEEQFTPVGRFIRNYSLDELPMLFNVVKGEMSIVGPRPTEVTVVDLHDPDWQRIVAVRPGIVSYSTLNLARDFNASNQRTRQYLELRYLNQRSMRFDLQVFRRALLALWRSNGNVKARGAPSTEGQLATGQFPNDQP